MSRLDNLKKAKMVIRNINDGRHPYTGEEIKPSDVCADDRIIQWFNFIEEELGNFINELENRKRK